MLCYVIVSCGAKESDQYTVGAHQPDMTSASCRLLLSPVPPCIAMAWNVISLRRVIMFCNIHMICQRVTSPAVT